MATILKERKETEQISDFTEDYITIRSKAENNWPEWKKIYYNESFATSSHAQKLIITPPKK